MANENDKSPVTKPWQLRSRWKEIAGSLAVILGLLLAAILTQSPVEVQAHPLEGKAAPPIRYELEKGKKTSLDDQKGNALLLNFWAVWCAPCIEEMPSLRALEDHFDAKGFQVLAFNVQDEGEVVRGEVDGIQMPRNLIYHFDRRNLEPYDITAIPVSILIDRSGVIRKVYRGPRDWMDLSVVREIESVLK